MRPDGNATQEAALAGRVQRDRAHYDRLADKLYAAVVSDILDSIGRPNQVLRAELAPIVGGEWTLVGRLRTTRAVAVDAPPPRPYEQLLRMIDSFEPGDVLFLGAGGRMSSGLFGGLLATAVKAAGGRGAIVDGGTRDVNELNRLSFPTIARGCCPADSLGRDEVVELDVVVECGGVRIEPGDVVVADADGTVIVPRDVEDRVVELALEKVSGENHVRRELANGMKASEAFSRYGIL
jgi:4-hydroxy-4-methyl-2-oxoglutarate aldolase